ncbi:MAG: DinB family protein [Cyanobacteria bacterium]|nr:DinB family protein [Cyanobacteriota bacterium]
MLGLSFDDLIEYTEWQRVRWRAWFRGRPEALALSTGGHSDGRFATVGDVVRHIFSAELRYVQRLEGEALFDLATIPTDDVEKLFSTGDETRRRLKRLLQSLSSDQWDVPRQFTMLQYEITATPKKIVAHTLMHEVRHWAQLATICRTSGLAVDADDLLASPLWGGDFASS